MSFPRVLLDSCVWGGVLPELQGLGWDVIWVPAQSPDPGDEEVLAWAQQSGRVLVTLDKDFGELVHNRGRAHAGIVRLQRTAARDQAALIARVVSSHIRDLSAGAIVVATPDRVRVRLRLAET